MSSLALYISAPTALSYNCQSSVLHLTEILPLALPMHTTLNRSLVCGSLTVWGRARVTHFVVPCFATVSQGMCRKASLLNSHTVRNVFRQQHPSVAEWDEGEVTQPTEHLFAVQQV